MATRASQKDITLKALELFQTCARVGSLQATAQETGLSVSTVSHHLRVLESHLGVALFDHSRKPLQLTPKGVSYLGEVDQALLILRKARAEAVSGNVAEARFLALGAIEDFESDVMPDLAVHLTGKMPGCAFTYHIGSSHRIIEMLRNRELDLGVTTSPPEHLRDLRDRPLLRDPFVVVLPADAKLSVEEVFATPTVLPFLQFSRNLIIARQIDAQLRRLNLTLSSKFECASNQTLLATVAAGAGWTISTPLLVSRARRFQPQLRMHPFPDKPFARTLSLVATPDCALSVRDLVQDRLRLSLDEKVIRHIKEIAPWLGADFRLLP